MVCVCMEGYMAFGFIGVSGCCGIPWPMCMTRGQGRGETKGKEGGEMGKGGEGQTVIAVWWH